MIFGRFVTYWSKVHKIIKEILIGGGEVLEFLEEEEEEVGWAPTRKQSGVLAGKPV